MHDFCWPRENWCHVEDARYFTGSAIDMAGPLSWARMLGAKATGKAVNGKERGGKEGPPKATNSNSGDASGKVGGVVQGSGSIASNASNASARPINGRPEPMRCWGYLPG